MPKKKIAFVTGSRADYGLLEPLIKACQDVFDVKLFVTGSHLSGQFGWTEHYIKEPIAGRLLMLVDSDEPCAVTLSQSLGLAQFATKFAGIDLLVVLGDRFEILPPVLAAYNVGVPVVHIQGSDTTKGSLDEGYRGCVRSLATHHFTVEEYGSLGCVFPDLIDVSDIPCDILVSYHPAIGDNFKELDAIFEALKDKKDVFAVAPNCDAKGREILKRVSNKRSTNNWHFAHSIPRATYLSLLKKAKFIIGNSSSGLIEAPSLGTPTINVGSRQDGRLRAASVINCWGDAELIEAAIKRAKQVKFPVNNPYYYKNTLQKMINHLRNILI